MHPPTDYPLLLGAVVPPSTCRVAAALPTPVQSRLILLASTLIFSLSRTMRRVREDRSGGRIQSRGLDHTLSDYVLAETVNLANARSGTRVAIRVLDLIEQSAGIRIEWIGTSRFDSTKAFFREHADHPYSFTDSTSFVMMRELKLSQALTTDHHFSQAGLDALLLTASQ
jgi:predicted nucleic acid-binding protein